MCIRDRFYTDRETLDMARFESIGIIKNEPVFDTVNLDTFLKIVSALKERRHWDRQDLVKLFHAMLPDFEHKETGKYLDGKM